MWKLLSIHSRWQAAAAAAAAGTWPVAHDHLHRCCLGGKGGQNSISVGSVRSARRTGHVGMVEWQGVGCSYRLRGARKVVLHDIWGAAKSGEVQVGRGGSICSYTCQPRAWLHVRVAEQQARNNPVSPVHAYSLPLLLYSVALALPDCWTLPKYQAAACHVLHFKARVAVA
jgi:hypothetical protein